MKHKLLKKIIGIFGYKLIEKNFVKNERLISSKSFLKIDKLLDVSPVTYPAYEETLAEARSILDTKPKKDNESDLINIIKLKHK